LLEGTEGSLRKGLQRWHAANPDHRVHVGFSPVPGRVDLLAAWQQGHQPTGALARHLLRCFVDHAPGTPAEEYDLLRGSQLGAIMSSLGREIDRHAWSDRACLLRGCGWVKQRVALVRDAVLGRSRARAVLGDEQAHKTVREVVTRTSGAELIEEMANRGVDLTRTAQWFDPWKREQSTTWQTEDAERLVRVWNDLVAEGFFLSRRAPPVLPAA